MAAVLRSLECCPRISTADKTDVMEPIGVWATNNPDTDRTRRARRYGGHGTARCRRDPSAGPRGNGSHRGAAPAYPGTNDQFGVKLQPIREVFVGDLRPTLLVLFGAVIFVLLIACATSRTVSDARRQPHTGNRAADRFRREPGPHHAQLLAESFLLAPLGGVLGVGLAVGGNSRDRAADSGGYAGGRRVNLNGAVLLFAGGAVVLAAFIFGLAPAMHSTEARMCSRN